jgi:hypothetical protein
MYHAMTHSQNSKQHVIELQRAGLNEAVPMPGHAIDEENPRFEPVMPDGKASFSAKHLLLQL